MDGMTDVRADAVNSAPQFHKRIRGRPAGMLSLRGQIGFLLGLTSVGLTFMPIAPWPIPYRPLLRQISLLSPPGGIAIR